jgi:hypothetical protein
MRAHRSRGGLRYFALTGLMMSQFLRQKAWRQLYRDFDLSLTTALLASRAMDILHRRQDNLLVLACFEHPNHVVQVVAEFAESFVERGEKR